MSSESERSTGNLLKTSGLIALVNLAGRILGFAGDTTKSHFFGAGSVVDAFNVAAAVPSLLNDLLIQSLVNSVYVPVFSGYQTAQEELWRLSNALVNVTSLLFLGAVLLLEIFAPQLVSLLNGGAPADAQALTVNLLRITIPALLLLNVSGILAGVLYARRRLVLPTLAGAAFNGAILVSALLLQSRLGIFAFAFGLLLGAVIQVAIQFNGLRGTGWPYRLTLWHPGLRRAAVLYAPILAGLLMEILVSRPVTFALASQTGVGGIAWMGYALTLRQVPEGLIATALSITVLVRLSAVSQADDTAFRQTLAEGLRLAFVLIAPATIGLFLLAQPVTALLFQHGNFTASDTRVVAQALRWYLPGLPFATVDLLLVIAFYARRNTLTPALIGAFTTLVYVGLSSALLHTMGLYSLMLADSVRFALHVCLSVYFLLRSVGSLSDLGVYRTLWQTILAVAVMGGVIVVVSAIITPGDNLLGKTVAALLPPAIGLPAYLVALGALGVSEIGVLRRALSLRLHPEPTHDS